MHGHLNVSLSRCTVTWTSDCHDARSPERQIITMHGHLNVSLSRCTVTWTSDCARRLFPRFHMYIGLYINTTVSTISISIQTGFTLNTVPQPDRNAKAVWRTCITVWILYNCASIAVVTFPFRFHSFTKKPLWRYIVTMETYNSLPRWSICLL